MTRSPTRLSDRPPGRSDRSRTNLLFLATIASGLGGVATVVALFLAREQSLLVNPSADAAVMHGLGTQGVDDLRTDPALQHEHSGESETSQSEASNLPDETSTTSTPSGNEDRLPPPLPYEQRLENVALSFPSLRTRRVGEVTISLNFNSYGYSDPYIRAELTAGVDGSDPVVLDPDRSTELQSDLATYVITVTALDVSGRTASVDIRSQTQ